MRLLLLAQRFHPAESVAAVRWSAFADELAFEGVKVGVICTRYPADGADDRVVAEVRRSGVPDDGAAATGPRAPSGAGRWSRAGLRATAVRLAVPDTAWVAWFRPRRALLDAARAFAPDVVVSTSPPQGVHLFGRWLSRRLGVPWVADFRDPYVGDGRSNRPQRFPWPQAHALVERRIVRSARAVLTVGEIHREELLERHGSRTPIVHVPNGFRPAGGARAAATRAAPDAEVLELAVMATAAPGELLVLAQAATLAWPERPLRLRTIGLPEPQVAELRQVLEVVDHPWSAPEDLGPLLEGASVLLLVLAEHRGRGGGTSTKLFQYLDADRPILAVNPTVPDERLLARWARSEVIRHPDVEAARRALVALVDAEADQGATDVEAFRATYRWPAIAGRLRAVLAEQVGPR